jgi:hypothetical protein
MLEYKLLVANIFRNFELECYQTIEEIIPEIKLVLKSEKPVIFKINVRQNDVF